jgi:hypothetical protein
MEPEVAVVLGSGEQGSSTADCRVLGQGGFFRGRRPGLGRDLRGGRDLSPKIYNDFNTCKGWSLTPPSGLPDILYGRSRHL